MGATPTSACHQRCQRRTLVAVLQPLRHVAERRQVDLHCPEPAGEALQVCIRETVVAEQERLPFQASIETAETIGEVRLCFPDGTCAAQRAPNPASCPAPLHHCRSAATRRVGPPEGRDRVVVRMQGSPRHSARPRRGAWPVRSAARRRCRWRSSRPAAPASATGGTAPCRSPVPSSERPPAARAPPPPRCNAPGRPPAATPSGPAAAGMTDRGRTEQMSPCAKSTSLNA